MTPKQEERIRNKIRKIKAALAADKKRWGGYYHDGQGLRYSPPRYYLQLGDFTGGLRYMNWFNKNFPDDIGYPEFLFEWAVILFKTGRIREAEKKAFNTFTRNTYLFDQFFGRPVQKIDKWEGSGMESVEYATDYFSYSCKQEVLSDFAHWLEKLLATEKFIALSSSFMDIYKRLEHERDISARMGLIQQADQLKDEL